MKTILSVSAVVFFAASSASFAADPVMPPPVAPMAPVVDSSTIWDGFYAGLNAGYGWGQGDATIGGVTETEDLSGWLGGAQVGYNFANGGFVFGVEGDIQAANIVYSEDLGGGVTGEIGIGSFGTVRARVGADLGGFMPYLTAGLAYGNHFYEVSGGGVTVSDNSWAFGYAAGAGVEAMIADNISLKAEYLYLDLGSSTLNVLGADIDVDSHAHTARVGFNFHF